jgi:hypothetical protein
MIPPLTAARVSVRKNKSGTFAIFAENSRYQTEFHVPQILLEQMAGIIAQLLAREQIRDYALPSPFRSPLAARL